jgi:6-phosphogluconolactonase
MSNLKVFPDRDGFISGAADFITELILEAVAANGRFTIALAGGGTPRPVYAHLGTADYAQRIPWDKVHIFFGDERCVPPDDSRSNFRMAREALLDQVPLPAGNIYRIHGEDDPAQAALAYGQEIQRFFRTATPPDFDLICLGMGDNGHTASLFPGTAALREQTRWVVPQYVEVMATWRVTFTTALINAARNVAFLVEGEGKTEMLWRVLEGPYDPDVLPSQLIQPRNGRLHWLVDAAAGAKVQ